MKNFKSLSILILTSSLSLARPPHRDPMGQEGHGEVGRISCSAFCGYMEGAELLRVEEVYEETKDPANFALKQLVGCRARLESLGIASEPVLFKYLSSERPSDLHKVELRLSDTIDTRRASAILNSVNGFCWDQSLLFDSDSVPGFFFSEEL
jgi:hypothetical protein